jgi:hypothetical protein
MISLSILHSKWSIKFKWSLLLAIIQATRTKGCTDPRVESFSRPKESGEEMWAEVGYCMK